MEQRPFNDNSYQQFLNEEKLMGSKCRKCGALYAPPRTICQQCHGTDMEWVELKGKGQLYAFTVISVGPPAMVAEGYDRNNPYISGVVKLDEGVRLDARIEGVDGKNPDSIKIGTPMTARFLHLGEGDTATTVLAFTA